MKLLRTNKPYLAVTLPDARDDEKADGDKRTLRFDRGGLLVANDHADGYVEAADAVGVTLVVSDAPDAPDDTEPGTPVGRVSAVPDLSKGIAAVHGTGEPVMTYDTAGDVPEGEPAPDGDAEGTKKGNS